MTSRQASHLEWLRENHALVLLHMLHLPLSHPDSVMRFSWWIQFLIIKCLGSRIYLSVLHDLVLQLAWVCFTSFLKFFAWCSGSSERMGSLFTSLTAVLEKGQESPSWSALRRNCLILNSWINKMYRKTSEQENENWEYGTSASCVLREGSLTKWDQDCKGACPCSHDAEKGLLCESNEDGTGRMWGGEEYAAECLEVNATRGTEKRRLAEQERRQTGTGAASPREGRRRGGSQSDRKSVV